VITELEKLLGNKLYPHYGSRECGLGGAVTCPAFEGMHLRENHIIAEIIDGDGNVLQDGAYGELVITTIGMEAMPLIRYRTGDFTRILPPCPCGGVTKRIDTVSRREGQISIEALDSQLFRIPELIDYRVTYSDSLRIEARVSYLSAMPAILKAAQALYTDSSVQVCAESAQPAHRPMYLGKRYIL